jgi:hypothetical protein
MDNMSFFAYMKSPFEYTHENKLFFQLYNWLHDAWYHKQESLHLIGNFLLGGRQIDALILKSNAIIVIDFKDYGGTIHFSENSKWHANKISILSGSSTNPFQQIRTSKFALKSFIENKIDLFSKPNLTHISGICLFHQPIQFDEQQLSPTINRWFHIIDTSNIIDYIEGISSPKIKFSDDELQNIVKLFDITPYTKNQKHEDQNDVQTQLRRKKPSFDLSDSFTKYELTQDQIKAIQKIEPFLSSPDLGVFILNGYAGTGKTFLVKGIVDYIHKLGKKCVIMAPTGKAALVIQKKTGSEATTIHKRIYTFSDQNQESIDRIIVPLKKNDDYQDTIYIVDEVSMLSDVYSSTTSLQFGSGYLLKDLVTYIRQNQNFGRKILFIGDHAQLPPVGMNHSPALNADYLHNEYHLPTYQCWLEEVVRQKKDSGVMANAVVLRQAINDKIFNQLIMQTQKKDIQSIAESKSLVNRYMQLCNRQVNQTSELVILAHTNKQVSYFNNKCREFFFPHQKKLCVKDKILFVANQYREDYTILNGQFGQITKILSEPETRHIVFNKATENGKKTYEKVHVTLTFIDVELVIRADNGIIKSLTSKIFEPLLYNDQPTLTEDERTALYVDLKKRYPKIEQKEQGQEQIKLSIMQNDPYFNALNIKFGYALTCHKAQGSEWEHVFVDASSSQSRLTQSYFRWLYTAITRTSSMLYILNEPNIKFNSNLNVIGFNALENPKKDQINCSDKIQVNLESPSMTQNLRKTVESLLNQHHVKIVYVTSSKYQECYRLQKDEHIVDVRIFYKKQNIISKIRHDSPHQIASEIYHFLKPLEGQCFTSSNSTPSTIEFKEDFLQKFHLKLSDVFNRKKIKIKLYSQNLYAQRYQFSNNTDNITIDFYYNKKGSFGTINEIPPKTKSNNYDQFSKQIVEIFTEIESI